MKCVKSEDNRRWRRAIRNTRPADMAPSSIILLAFLRFVDRRPRHNTLQKFRSYWSPFRSHDLASISDSLGPLSAVGRTAATATLWLLVVVYEALCTDVDRRSMAMFMAECAHNAG